MFKLLSLYFFLSHLGFTVFCRSSRGSSFLVSDRHQIHKTIIDSVIPKNASILLTSYVITSHMAIIPLYLSIMHNLTRITCRIKQGRRGRAVFRLSFGRTCLLFSALAIRECTERGSFGVRSHAGSVIYGRQTRNSFSP